MNLGFTSYTVMQPKVFRPVVAAVCHEVVYNAQIETQNETTLWQFLFFVCLNR